MLGQETSRSEVEFRPGPELTLGAAVTAYRARAVATDLSAGMLARARPVTPGPPGRHALVQCDARALPFAPASFDVAFSAYGALPHPTA